MKIYLPPGKKQKGKGVLREQNKKKHNDHLMQFILKNLGFLLTQNSLQIKWGLTDSVTENTSELHINFQQTNTDKYNICKSILSFLSYKFILMKPLPSALIRRVFTTKIRSSSHDN